MRQRGILKRVDAVVHADNLRVGRVKLLQQARVRTVEAHHDCREHGHVIPQCPDIPLHDGHSAIDDRRAIELN